MQDSALNRKEKRTLSTFFHPVFVWLRVLGIYLTADNNSPSLCSAVHSLIMLSISFGSNAASLYGMVFEPSVYNANSDESYTLNLALVIANLNYVVMVVGIHFVLLSQTRVHWRKLWKTIITIESQQLPAQVLERMIKSIRLISLVTMTVILTKCT